MFFCQNGSTVIRFTLDIKLLHGLFLLGFVLCKKNKPQCYPLFFTNRDPNTIFRGNSLTSKCIDETMKLAGMHYLQVTLKPIIDEVLKRLSPFFVVLLTLSKVF